MSFRDDLLRHQVFLQRLIKAEVKAVRPILTAAELAAIVSTDKRYDAARVKEVVKAILSEAGPFVIARMQAVAAYEAKFTYKKLKKLASKVSAPDLEKIPDRLDKTTLILGVGAAALTLAETFDLFAKTKAKQAAQAVRDAEAQKTPPEEAHRVLKSIFAGVVTYQMISLLDSSINKSANIGRAETYSKNKELVEMVAWTNDLDSNVCPYCEDLDGEEMSVDEFDDLYPAHANCACFATPVFAPDAEF